MRLEHRGSPLQISGLLVAGLLLTWPGSVWSQIITATLPVSGPVAVNKVTNKIYVAGKVIDGTTGAVTTVPTGPNPCALAVNEATNRIYVTNAGALAGGEVFLGYGSVTVIDGATNSSTTLTDPNIKFPCALALNPATNKIYVANRSGNTAVTIIDGATNSTTAVTDPNGTNPNAVAVNAATNKIYVTNGGAYPAANYGNITVIDGATNSTTTITDPNGISPNAVAVNAATNKIYVTNGGAYSAGVTHSNITVIDGATNSTTTLTDANALAPQAVAVDETTNKIYVTNGNDSALSGIGSVSVIDGATNAISEVRDPNAMFPHAVTVDPVADRVYVTNEGCFLDDPCKNPGSVTVINAATDSTITIINPQARNPEWVAVNPTTDQVYVANVGSGNLSIIDGAGTPAMHTLAVVMAGSGTGTVTSSPLGMSCEPTCTESLAAGRALSLNGTAASGSVFAGWDGPCTGTGSCDLVANSDQFVTATFAAPQLAVPDVIGMTQATATSTITGAGLTAGTVSLQSSSTVPSGSVISESPATGTSVASGSAVSLVVSNGSSATGSTGGTDSSGGTGGGGGIDALTLGGLLGSLIAGLRTARAGTRPWLSGTAVAINTPERGALIHTAACARRGLCPLLMLLGAGLALPVAAQHIASREMILSTCPQVAGLVGASECGYLPVPLFEGPSSPMIDIYFEVYPHRAPGPAVSAIFANGGGPGVTTTGFRSVALSLYGALDVHDMVLFDDRGRGSSAAIDCPDLQHGTAPFDQAVAECAEQLGAGASAYGTGAIADDAEALRIALGYDKIDYVGLSYGAEDATAYATRYGAHVRSIVLDSPAGSPYLARFAADRGSTQSIPRSIELGCRRSPTCAVDHPDPDSELGALIHSIHDHPLIGSGNDAFGAPTPVSLDEGSLAALLTAGTFPPPGSGGFVDNNEVLAAARAYAAGDSVPLLRIAAEGSIPLSIDYGHATTFSEGAFIATQCVDMQQPFSWRDPVSVRGNELSEAITDLPTDYFAPFTRDVARYPIFAFEGQCLDWQKPTPSDPVLPPKSVFPDVPVLVLHGDMDAAISTEEAQAVAAQFPQSTFVTVASSGHITADYGFFGACMAYNFLENLQADDTTCAQTPQVVWPAVGRFPLLAGDALPAKPAPGNLGTLHDLKIVSVAVATMKDALQRTALGSTSGVGLRGGTFLDTSGATSQLITLNSCSFTQDVSVSGTITYGSDTSVVATLLVTVPGGTTSTLIVKGAFLTPGPAGSFSVTGSIGGRIIAALVPEA